MAITIRPGMLVSLKSSVRGGVTYDRVDIVTGEKLASGAKVSKWNTTKTVEDPEELERAEKCRSKARGLVSKVCTASAFGLLCPEANEGALDAAVAEARKLADEHNSDPRTKCTHVAIFVMKGRVASDDAEAMRSITSEISDLIAQMDQGIKNFDPEMIRKAAKQAREVSTMLGEREQGKINAAIEQARKAARTIVQRIETDGEDKATVLLDIQRGQIESARIAFLDMGEVAPTGEAAPAVNVQRFAELDMADEPKSETLAAMDRDSRKASPSRAIEMEV